jgi:D-alanyl-D-alanine carboxypeptidase
MTARLAVLVLFTLVLLPARACGQGVALPATPAARQAEAFLEVVRGADAAARQAFVEDALAPELRDGYPLERHLEMMDMLARDLRGARLAGTRARGEQEIQLTFERGDGSRLLMTVSTVPEPPYRVSGLSVRVEAPGATRLELESFEQADETLAAMAARDEFSGVVLAARGDEVVFHRAYGSADRTAGRPAGLDTRFDIGSLDKLFTSTVVLRLAELGALELDAPVGRYLQGLDPAVLERTTVRHLLQHRGGLGDYLTHPAFRDRPGSLRSTVDFLELVREQTLLFEPGTETRYSNAGFVVLGAIVEAVSSRPYHDVVREHVLEPAGMSDTGPRRDERSAVRYSREGGSLVDTDGRWPATGSPAGGGYSTARDLHRFMAALLADRLLAPASTDLLLNGLEPPASGRSDRTRGRGGFGGGAPGLNAELAFDGATGRIVAVVANLDPPIAARVGAAVMDMEW